MKYHETESKTCQNLKKCHHTIITSLVRSPGFQEFEAPRFPDNQHMKVIRLSALCTGCLCPQEIFLVLICYGLSQP